MHCLGSLPVAMWGETGRDVLAQFSRRDAVAIMTIGLVIGGPVIVIGKLWQLSKDSPTVAISIVAIVLMGAHFFVGRRRERREAAASDAMEICRKLTQEHIESLTNKRQEMLSVGEYGEVFEGDFDQEIAYFVATVVQPHIRDQLVLLGDPNLIGPSQQVISNFIKAEIAKVTPAAM